MKYFSLLLILVCSIYSLQAQKVISLPFEKTEGVAYQQQEKEYFSKAWNTTVITNVSTPTLTVFEPSVDKKNGTSVIIAPGGGLYAHSITSEGIDVANWLVSKGVTAFVLKYRLVPTGEDGTVEIGEGLQKDPQELMRKVHQVLPSSVQDGLNAIDHVRSNASEYGLDANKIGFMGFSAGGAVTMGVAYGYEQKNRPDFLVPVYPWTTAISVQTPPEDAPPMLIICATNDGLGLASGSIELYNSWYTKGLNVGLHMYSKGDHGFGMRTLGLPSDSWIERFYEWAVVEKIIE